MEGFTEGAHKDYSNILKRTLRLVFMRAANGWKTR